MLDTATEVYEDFLRAIHKEQTGTVFPEQFEYLANTAQMNVLEKKAPEVELDQKRIDDLSVLRVITDGSVVATHIPLTPDAPVGSNLFSLPDGTAPYPEYFRMLNVRVKLLYYSNPCYTNGIASGYKKATVITSNKKPVILESVYRKPNGNTRLYYEIIAGKIQTLVDMYNSYATHAIIEYLRMPEDITLAAGPSAVDNIEDYPVHIKKEIIDEAVRLYHGRVPDDKYQIDLTEKQIKQSHE